MGHRHLLYSVLEVYADVAVLRIRVRIKVKGHIGALEDPKLEFKGRIRIRIRLKGTVGSESGSKWKAGSGSASM
jgi:hypothetical protein